VVKFLTIPPFNPSSHLNRITVFNHPAIQPFLTIKNIYNYALRKEEKTSQNCHPQAEEASEKESP
jgi:hypothetical protein